MNKPIVDVDMPGIVSVETESPLESTDVVVTGSAYVEA